MSMNQYRVKTVSLNGNKYTYTMTGDGLESFRVHIYANGSTRQLYTAKIQAAIMAAVVEADHAEALEMNVGIELALHIITGLGGADGAGDAAGGCLYRDGFNEINYLVSVALSMYARREEAHAEALEINTQVDSELAKLCRVIAGINRSEYKDETKRQLIGAACSGLVDGLRERLGAVLSRDMLPGLTVRAAK